MADKERWVPVVGWEGLYEVSDHGHVRSLTRSHNMVHWRDGSAYSRRYPGRQLRWVASTPGYPQVCLSRDGKVDRVFVHRLVADAFLTNPQKLPVVNHLNGNKQDPRAANLEWTTHSGNARHSIDRGLSAKTPRKCCETLVRLAYTHLAKTKKPTLAELAALLGVDWLTAKTYVSLYSLDVLKRRSPTKREAVKG